MGRKIILSGLLALLAWALCSVAALAEPADADEGMVGAEVCGRCHPGALAVWEKSAHRRANAALSGKQASDARCLQCHGQHGVQCEDCHGLGQHYAARYVMKDAVLSRLVGLVDVDQKVCLRCHTDSAPSLAPFDYAEMVDIIAHGQADRKEKTERKD